MLTLFKFQNIILFK